MYNNVKITIDRINTALAITLFCTVAAQANVYTPAQEMQELLAPGNTPAQSLNSARAPLRVVQGPANSQWLPSVGGFTTLHLSSVGLGSPAARTTAAPDGGLRAPLAVGAFSALSAADHKAADTAAKNQDRIITASIPATAAPAGAALSRTIRPQVPLFGAHRIRFGKIKSGDRISGLIRKAAAKGSSAICINQCAALADRLTLKGASLNEQLRHVSASVNRMVAYRTDQESHGKLDHWSTPNETLGRSSGDCEDYAVLKMAILARLGIPMTAMEIVVVKDTSRRLFHAVLSVALEDRSLILDNMTDAVEADKAKLSYAPLFSISGTANYVFGYKGGKSNMLASLKNIAAIAPGAGF